MVPYLQQLLMRLGEGISHLDEQRLNRHRLWIASKQQSDGGFPGRDAGSDLYYTSFALRSLALLDGLGGSVATRVAQFLQARLGGQETVLDFLSLLYSGFLLRTATGLDVFSHLPADWLNRVAHWLESLRRDDGGFAKGPDGQAGSTYHSFLVLLTLQLIDKPLSEPNRLVEFLLRQRAPEGGFLEIRVAKRAGTNPTAAAVAALEILGALTEEIRQETIVFLTEMQTEEGGLRANGRIPVADLLSTFTGAWTMDRLGALDAIDLHRLHDYVRRLEGDQGGFRAGEFDTTNDVEYTFYGLGTLALVTPRIQGREPL